MTLHVHVFPDLTRKRFLPTHRVYVNCLLFFRTSRCGSISVGKTFRGCCSHRNPYCFPLIHLMELSSHSVKTSIFFLQIYGEKIRFHGSLFACCEIFHAFEIFFKINLHNFFQENYQFVKLFGYRSGSTFCPTFV